MKARINYLLRQYFYNKSSRQELDELFALIQSAKYDTQVAELIKTLYEELKRQDPSLIYVNDDGRLLDFDNWPQAKDPETQLVKPYSAKVRRLYIVLAAAAAILVLAFFFRQYGVDYRTEEQVLVIKRAAADENKVLTLSDGTKVWVNSSSRLEYPQEFKKGQPREVTLIGEAYFEVERAQDWPFIVHTGDVQTKVLGTKFNIKAYPEMKDILVTVKSGKVMVSKMDKMLATLVKNEELRIPTAMSVMTEPVQEKKLQSKIAGNWTAGYLDYEDEEIASIVKDLERHFGIKIQLQQEALAKKVITLAVEKDSTPTEVLKILTTLTNTKFKMDEDNYIIF